MNRLTKKSIYIIILGSLFLAACNPKTNNSNAGTPIVESQETNLPDQSSERATSIPTLEINENVSDSIYDEYELITLLPFDAIPAIDNPVFLSADEADLEYAPKELVLGVNINGESKAYSINLLSSHEIVNDSVGGAKIAVTW